MKKILFALIAFAFVACSPEASTIRGRFDKTPDAPEKVTDPTHKPDVKLPPPQHEKKPEVSRIEPKWEPLLNQLEIEFNPRLDIAFVMDNSLSMDQTQGELVDGMDQFVDAFAKNQIVKVHVGVTTVWCNRQAREYTIGGKKRLLPSFEDMRKQMGVDYSKGALRRAVLTDGTLDSKRYIEQGLGFVNSLKSTLKVGTMGLSKGGPEFEQLFSPVAALFQRSAVGDVNEGFFQDDSTVVVVLVTDAEDSTPDISPEELAAKLRGFRGNRPDKVAAYLVGVRKSDPDSIKDDVLKVRYENGRANLQFAPQCFDVAKPGAEPIENGRCQGGIGPEKLEKFIVLANQDRGMTPEEIKRKHILPIRGFGTQLAEMSRDLIAQVKTKEIPINRVITLNEQGRPNIRVRYGSEEELKRPFGSPNSGQVIPEDLNDGWSLNLRENQKSILLSPNINYDFREKGKIAIEVIPANAAVK